MKRKYLLFLVAFALICSPILVHASSKSTSITVGSTKSFTTKGYGKIKKVSYSYPDKKHKAKVTVKKYSNKVKITGKKAGKIKVKLSFSSKKSKTYNITVKSKKKEVVNTLSPYTTASPTETPVVTSTPAPEHESIASLISLEDKCDTICVNNFEYNDVWIEKLDHDNDGIYEQLYVRAKSILNITTKELVPDGHVKFYDKNGDLVCEHQMSWDTGSHWNITLKPNEEYLIFMFSSSPSSMNISKEDFKERVKYWKLADIE